MSYQQVFNPAGIVGYQPLYVDALEVRAKLDGSPTIRLRARKRSDIAYGPATKAGYEGANATQKDGDPEGWQYFKPDQIRPLVPRDFGITLDDDTLQAMADGHLVHRFKGRDLNMAFDAKVLSRDPDADPSGRHGRFIVPSSLRAPAETFSYDHNQSVYLRHKVVGVNTAYVDHSQTELHHDFKIPVQTPDQAAQTISRMVSQAQDALDYLRQQDSHSPVVMSRCALKGGGENADLRHCLEHPDAHESYFQSSHVLGLTSSQAKQLDVTGLDLDRVYQLAAFADAALTIDDKGTPKAKSPSYQDLVGSFAQQTQYGPLVRDRKDATGYQYQAPNGVNQDMTPQAPYTPHSEQLALHLDGTVDYGTDANGKRMTAKQQALAADRAHLANERGGYDSNGDGNPNNDAFLKHRPEPAPVKDDGPEL